VEITYESATGVTVTLLDPPLVGTGVAVLVGVLMGVLIGVLIGVLVGVLAGSGVDVAVAPPEVVTTN
jgi:TctA family transporter